MKLTKLSLCLAWCAFVPLASAQSAASTTAAAPAAPEANPGRPTVSTPATLTPVGYLQFETGVLGANHSPEFSSSYGLNEVIKLSVAPRLELLVSVDPVARSAVDGVTSNSPGDISLGAQAVIIPGEGARPTVAISYFHELYSGSAPDLDIGSATNSFLVLASADVKGFHFDANAFFNEMNEIAPSEGGTNDVTVRRAQFGQTLSISHHIAGRFAVSGEIWHFTQPFLRGQAIGNLWAVGYTARKTLVLDAGFNCGITDTSTRWEYFAGFTYLLPRRLWNRSFRPRAQTDDFQRIRSASMN